MPVVPQILLAHPGTQYSFQLARELYRRDYLQKFYTCFSLSSETKLAHWMSPLAKLIKIDRQWQNRIVSGLPPDKLRCYPFLEIKSWCRFGDHNSAGQLIRVRNERFQRLIPDEAIATSELVI